MIIKLAQPPKSQRLGEAATKDFGKSVYVLPLGKR